MREMKHGLRVDYLPSQIKIGAVNEDGLRGLNEWMGPDKDGSKLRAKFKIDESTWPILKYDQLKDGKIFRVIFEQKQEE